jgi:hypothetical protein
MVEDLSIQVLTYGDEHKFESSKTRTEYGLELTRVIHNLLLEAESLDHQDKVTANHGVEEIVEERSSVSLLVRPPVDLKSALMTNHPADGDTAFDDGQSTAGVGPAYMNID